MITQGELALDTTRPWREETSAIGLARGVCRLMQALDCVALAEFPLSGGRRADILALDRRGEFVIVEIKSGLADFRGDSKWPDYLPHCDRFYFAVAADFPLDELPPEAGIMLADGHGAECLREAPPRAMQAALRRKQTLRFARIAGNRLRFLHEPQP
ncbi:MAG: MmcB family DNA repair protein [Alphaproteobacteria bacterium]|jgi:hypothetical protein|nr:MmcB family DNA repair protein [Alphaproteobacteria bacterium]MDP6589461.1 MmcB family DNA repair protein [Alphaproteobacteria bacterium]MDP6816477.1 MmcB family DNA repair protein [Alphaproteobacteria bacterium]